MEFPPYFPRKSYFQKVNKVNIHEKLALINDYWNPKVVGEINGQQVRLVKLLGDDFDFHHHPNDEMFFVVKGEIDLEFQDEKINLCEGDFYIIPKGTVHRPVAKEEAEIMLFVNAGNINTGDIQNNYTLDSSNLENI